MAKKIRKAIMSILRKARPEKDVEEFRFNYISAMVSRKEREIESNDDYMIGVIKLFTVNNPHKTTSLPVKLLNSGI